MSLNNYLSNLPKYIKFSLAVVFLFGLVTLPLFYLNTEFNIDIPKKVKNIFIPTILPDGYCKDCNVILITLDTLRAKSLPCYGYEKNTAPNICEFAKKSFLFTNTYSPSPKTLDSHSSIFTSLYPLSHRMTVPFSSNLSPEVVTLTQVLKQNGYATFYRGLTSDPNLPLKRGLERGFDSIIDAGTPDGWLKSLKDYVIQKNKFFAFFHTYWVHSPYIPEKINISRFYSGKVGDYISWAKLCKQTYEKLNILYPERLKLISGDVKQIDYCNDLEKYDNRYAFSLSYDEFNQVYEAGAKTYWDTFANIEINERKVYIQALYETRIYELDQEMKKLFNFLENENLIKNTIIIVTADHGEEFYEHGNWVHSRNLYNEVIKVPLIVYIPNSKGSIIDKLTSSVDIAPSILRLLNLQVPSQFIGINLFSEKNNNFVISQNYNIQKRSIISKDWKLLVNHNSTDNGRTRELYNLITDPNEQNNLEEKNNTKADQLEQNLNKILSTQPVYEQRNNDPLPTWIDEEQRKKLIETGYF